MKLLLGHHGLRGDIFMGVPIFDYFKKVDDRNKLFININKNYQDMAPLFYNHPSIDGIFISDSYDNFPSDLDNNNLDLMEFNYILNPMQPHLDGDDWFLRRDQVTETAFSYNLFQKETGHIFYNKIKLNQWFELDEGYSKYIAFHSTPGYYNPNNDKAPSKENAQEIVDSIIKLGYKVFHIKGPNEPDLERVTVEPGLNFFQSMKRILSCKCFVGYDTGITWGLSGYDFPVLAMYSHAYYGKDYIKNIQPVNPNAKYLSANNVNDLDIDDIISKLGEIL